MRKWMRDRLKRPKKNAEGGKSEPAQAPLQPAYYDAADAPAPPARARITEVETAEAESEPVAAPERPAIQDDAPEARPRQLQRSGADRKSVV